MTKRMQQKIENKWPLFLAFLLFFLSRLFFANPLGVFFDSNEYLDLFADPSYFHAIVSGHFPPHEGYIILFWPIYQLAQILQLPPALSVILTQICLGFVTLYCFYRVVAFVTDKKTALIAAIIVSLTPLFWIVTDSIMMENAYIGLFFLSLFLLTRYLTTKKAYLFHLSLLLFSLAFLTHMLLILWLPLYLFTIYYKQKSLLINFILWSILYVVGMSVLNVLFISLVSKETLPAVFHHLYFTKGNELSAFTLTPRGILITLRNFLIPLIRNNTSVLTLVGFLSFVYFFFKDKKIFFLGLFFLLPELYANQWWDSLFVGRHALVASFGLAFLAAALLKKHHVLLGIFTVYLFVVTIPGITLLRGDIPYLVEAAAVETLSKDSLLIETHFAKPQVEETYTGKLIAVNDPLWPEEKVKEAINEYLASNKPVYISSGALSEPYGLYSGPYVHSLTLSYLNPFKMKAVLAGYTLVPDRIINTEDNLLLYRIIQATPSAYPEIKPLNNSRRRLDYTDPLWRLWHLITENEKAPAAHVQDSKP